MTTLRLEKGNIPEPNDDDFLDRVERSAGVARSFKELVIELSSKDWTDDIPPHELSIGTDVGDHERLVSRPHLYLGDHNIVPARSTEVDRANFVESFVRLSTPNGGRCYELVIETLLGMITTVEYYEDKSPAAGARDEILDVLSRFAISQEMQASPGIAYSQLDMVEAVTRGIRAVKLKGRLKEVECPGV